MFLLHEDCCSHLHENNPARFATASGSVSRVNQVGLLLPRFDSSAYVQNSCNLAVSEDTKKYQTILIKGVTLKNTKHYSGQFYSKSDTKNKTLFFKLSKKCSHIAFLT